MSNLAELIAQKQALDTAIAEAAKSEYKQAMQTIQSLMRLHNLTEVKLDEVVIKPVKKVAPQYKDPVSGIEWSGRGHTPEAFKQAKESGTLESMRITA
jgi:DNA-binding protein H-NS